jgi:hypothetical protein
LNGFWFSVLEVQAWLARHRRFHVYVTPAGSSWINQVAGSASPRLADHVPRALGGPVLPTSVLRRQSAHRPKQLEAGPFAADVASFRLHLAAENKAAGTVRTYTEAAQWFDPDDPQRGDVDLRHREITVHGKGRKTRTVKISHDAARAI